MAIATLTIDINAKLASLERDMGKASRIAEQNAKRMNDAFKGFGNTLKTLGAALSVGTFANIIKGAIDAQDNLKDLSKSTSISIEDLAGLSSAAQKSGGDLESIAASINKLSVNIGKEPEKFRAIGVSAKDPIEAFKQLADVFVRIKDPQERAAFGAEALGKSWAGAAPLLSEGSVAIGQMVDKGRNLSKITAESAAKADELNDSLVDLKTLSSSVATNFANLLVPSLTDTARAMERLASEGNPVLALLRGFAGLGKLPFDLAFGSIDNSVKGQIADLEKTLSELKTKQSRAGTGGGGIINELVFGKKGEFDQQILVVQNQIAALKKYGDLTKKPVQSDEFVGPPVDLSGFLGNKKDKKTPKAAKAKDPYSDLLTPAAEAYSKAIESINSAMSDAEKSTLTLDAAQETLHDLMKSSVWADMPEPWKELVIAQSEAASEAIKVAEEYSRLQTLLGAGQSAILEKTRSDMLLLAKAFNEGIKGVKITAEQFSEAAMAALGNIPDEAKKATDAMDEFALQAARNIQDAFADFLFDPFKDGLDGMLKGFGEMVKRMIANAVAADLAKRLFGSLSGGEGDGWIGGLLKGVSAIFNAQGNVYDSPGLSAYSGTIVSKPTIFPFATGIGMMGEAGPEAIMPLKRGADGKLGVSSSAAGNTINVYVTGTNAPDVRRAAGQGAREAMAAISGAGRYN